MRYLFLFNNKPRLRSLFTTRCMLVASYKYHRCIDSRNSDSLTQVGILSKYFCTDKTSRIGNQVDVADDDKNDVPPRSDRLEPSHRLPSKYSNKQQKSNQNNDLGTVKNASRPTATDDPSHSLYNLSFVNKSSTESNEEEGKSADFVRHQIKSQWRYPSARQETDSNRSDFHDPPIARENRKPLMEPAYYGGIAGFLACSLVIAMAIFRKKKPDSMEVLIAKSWVAERDGNLAEAEDLLHKALMMAQDKDHSDAVTYIYDQMANLAMRHRDLSKAEELFKETLKRMISSGTPQDDSAVVEISLKLSRMYDRMKRYDEAEQGFQWCIETTEKNLKATTDRERRQNHQSLLGMCLDALGRFQASHGQLQNAIASYTRAISLCENELKVDGVPHPQTAVLLNDLGTIYDLGGNYSEATETIERAITIAEKGSTGNLPTVLCNLASVKMHTGKFEEARNHYKRALSLAEKQNDAAVILQIKNNLAQLDTNIYLDDIKKHQVKTQK